MPADLPAKPSASPSGAKTAVPPTFEFSLWDLPQTGSIEMDGRTWIRRRRACPLEALPLGYHDITAAAGGAGSRRPLHRDARARLDDPHLGRGGRAAGIAVSLYGVRSARNWGCGDFRDLLDVVDWAADDLQASFVGLNPLHAIHNRRPFNTSPYLPNCIFYRNFLYLDVEGDGGFRRARAAAAPSCAAARGGRRNRSLARTRRSSNTSASPPSSCASSSCCSCSFCANGARGSPRAASSTRSARAKATCSSASPPTARSTNTCTAAIPICGSGRNGRRRYQDPDSAETRRFPRANTGASVMFYQYLQWQIDLQLRRAQQRARDRASAIGLYHDLALATDRFGSDLWAHRDFFVAGCRVGSPPDDFAPKGQDWGFPPPNSERHREDGYRLFAESIRKNCRHGGALRIDHVMRLFRLYWIPDGCDATEGAYVARNLARISCAFWRSKASATAWWWWAKTWAPWSRRSAKRWPASACSVTACSISRSTPTAPLRRYDEYPRAGAGLLHHPRSAHAGRLLAGRRHRRAPRRRHPSTPRPAARQIAARLEEKQKMLDMLFELGLLPPGLPRRASAYPELTGELHNAVVGFLAMTPSQLLAINQEDLTKETAQQNLPGTTWQYPNWGRKMRFTLEQLPLRPRGPRLHRHVPQLDRPRRKREPVTGPRPSVARRGLRKRGRRTATSA